jgi:hypothetical protein
LEVAQALGVSESRVKEILAHANAFLGARLTEDALPDVASPAKSLRWPQVRDGLVNHLEADLATATR